MNYEAELKKFKKKKIKAENLEINEDKSISDILNEIDDLRDLSKNNNKISKKSVIQLSQVNNNIKNLQRRMDQLSESMNDNKIDKNEKELIIDKLIFVSDQLDIIREFVKDNLKSSEWQKTLDKTVSKTKREMEKIGLEKIYPENIKADPELHRAIDIANKKGIEKNIIVKVLKAGYLYQDQIIRKAEVIVNK
ncbi:MAG: nucleotide exchange factor GrpE [Bacillota bacterium]